ncbi:MAG: thioredoxin-disulfide reductase [Lachnospiraceae bacterium]|jgi:thioredoxin reductase (NADPH)|nr:thioredoxin-disulfide reductase [Lachnospiraceae bacterium]
MSELYDVIIIGAGPAGLTAGIYAARADLKTLLIERYGAGGQILNTYEVDNYPGLAGITGGELGAKMSEHLDKFNVTRLMTEVEGIDFAEGANKVKTDTGTFIGKTVILATGNSPRKLGIPGEEELTGAGVSYCATCDGAFFKKRTVAVIGGGDVAVEDAIFLARGCEKVYLVHRRDELRAAKILQKALFELPNVEVVWDSIPKEIVKADTGMVGGLTIENVKSHEVKTLEVSGVFIATGNNPNSSYTDAIDKDENGYIKADESCATSLPGVFAAGDVRTKRLRQVSTAVADGANAVYSVQEFLI